MSNGKQNPNINEVNVDNVRKHITAFMRNHRPVEGEKKPTANDVANAMKFFGDFFEKPEPQQKAPPGCFFLSSDSLNILTHVPNFQGISIYLGKDKEKEILILVPVITGSDPENLYTLDVVANGEPKTLSTSQVLAFGSCPPPPPPCKVCPCS